MGRIVNLGKETDVFNENSCPQIIHNFQDNVNITSQAYVPVLSITGEGYLDYLNLSKSGAVASPDPVVIKIEIDGVIYLESETISTNSQGYHIFNYRKAKFIYNSAIPYSNMIIPLEGSGTSTNSFGIFSPLKSKTNYGKPTLAKDINIINFLNGPLVFKNSIILSAKTTATKGSVNCAAHGGIKA